MYGKSVTLINHAGQSLQTRWLFQHTVVALLFNCHAYLQLADKLDKAVEAAKREALPVMVQVKAVQHYIEQDPHLSVWCKRTDVYCVMCMAVRSGSTDSCNRC